MKLTAKQKKFCDEYLIDLNATQAAIRAGYSKKAARDIACENLTKPYIKKYIESKQNKYQEALDLTVEEVVTMIIDTAKNGEQENNRLKATDMLMKYFGGYEKDNKLDITAQIKRTIIVNPTKTPGE